MKSYVKSHVNTRVNTSRRGIYPSCPAGRAGRLLLLASIVALAACETKSERDCPVFNHPVASEWQPKGVGEAALFADIDGLNSSYVLASITPNEAFTETARGTERDITCLLTSEHRFNSENSDESLVMLFSQDDVTETPPSQHRLVLDIIQEQPEGVQISKRFELTATNVVREDQSGIQRQRTYFANMEIGNRTYEDVVEIVYLIDEESGTNFADSGDDNPQVLQRVVVARNAGIVQFNRVDGSMHTLVAP